MNNSITDLEHRLAVMLSPVSKLVGPMLSRTANMFYSDMILKSLFSSATAGGSYLVRAHYDVTNNTQNVVVSWFIQDHNGKIAEKLQRFQVEHYNISDSFMFLKHVHREVLRSSLEDMANSPAIHDHYREFMELVLMAYPEWLNMQKYLAGRIEARLCTLDEAQGDPELVDLLMCDKGIISPSIALRVFAGLLLQEIITTAQFVYPARLEVIGPFHRWEETSRI
jgi:hypothetical protein